MRGSLNIAVADFGILSDGRTSTSALGSDLSASMYEELTTQYETIKGAATGEGNRTPINDVLIWHDTMPPAREKRMSVLARW